MQCSDITGQDTLGKIENRASILPLVTNLILQPQFHHTNSPKAINNKGHKL